MHVGARPGASSSAVPTATTRTMRCRAQRRRAPPALPHRIASSAGARSLPAAMSVAARAPATCAVAANASRGAKRAGTRRSASRPAVIASPRPIALRATTTAPAGPSRAPQRRLAIGDVGGGEAAEQQRERAEQHARRPRLTRRARGRGPDGGRVDEPVADAPHVDDVALAVGAELAAQAAGVRVERPRRADRRWPQIDPQQLGLREDARGIPRQHPQQRELLGAEVQRRTAEAHDPRGGVDLEPGDAHPAGAARALGAAQHARDAAAQLAVGERLGDTSSAPRSKARTRSSSRRRRRAGRPARRVDAARDAVALAHVLEQVEPRVIRQLGVDDREVREGGAELSSPPPALSASMTQKPSAVRWAARNERVARSASTTRMVERSRLVMPPLGGRREGLAPRAPVLARTRHPRRLRCAARSAG